MSLIDKAITPDEDVLLKTVRDKLHITETVSASGTGMDMGMRTRMGTDMPIIARHVMPCRDM